MVAGLFNPDAVDKARSWRATLGSGFQPSTATDSGKSKSDVVLNREAVTAALCRQWGMGERCSLSIKGAVVSR